MKKLVVTIVIGAMSASTGMAVVVDFNSDSNGNMSSSWSRDSGNLFQVQSGIGTGGSQGVNLSTAASNSYRMVYNQGVAGTEITLRTDFQIEINDGVPVDNNHRAFNIYLSDNASWWTGNREILSFARRDAGRRYGLQIDGSVAGWEQNSEIGLPNTLPSAGNTATSAWFTLEMTVTDNGDDTWDVVASVLDDTDTVLYTRAVAGAANWTSGSTLYGGIGADWNGASLQTGKIDTLNLDNFELIPEPGTLSLITAFGGAVLFIRRRFMI